MNKKVILLFAAIFGIGGAYVPILFGDTALISEWSVLGSAIGGLFGIWLAVILLKRWG